MDLLKRSVRVRVCPTASDFRTKAMTPSGPITEDALKPGEDLFLIIILMAWKLMLLSEPAVTE